VMLGRLVNEAVEIGACGGGLDSSHGCGLD
jgi:hypothetical protein